MVSHYLWGSGGVVCGDYCLPGYDAGWFRRIYRCDWGISLFV